MARGKSVKMSNNSINNDLPSHNLPSSDEILDENTQEALDLLFVNDQQTYEEFLSSFLYLNYKVDGIKNFNTAMQPASNILEASTSTSSQDKNEYKKKHPDITTNYDNDLQQEYLGIGNSTGSGNDRPKTSRLQLDNFVDDESLLSDDDQVDYYPSICEGISRKSNVKSASCVSSLSNVDKSVKNRVTLPGEIEIHDPTNIDVNLRSLNICTMLTESGESFPENVTAHTLQQESVEEAECCEVVSFTMDDDFDYDNVRLRPKFHFTSDREWK